jgi:gliding motility-associated-like protein
MNLWINRIPWTTKLLISALACPSLLGAQFLQVTGGNQAPYTPTNLISNVLLGDGVEVTSVTYAGNPVAVGYFSGGSQSIGMERGIVMTTGLTETGGGFFGCAGIGNEQASFNNNSNATNANLSALTTGPLFDACIYTITFIPTSDTLQFRYCFGSEEYPEYSCSPFNDVFGFFIQGPGYASPTNIALIPGTALPVTINNLHPFNVWAGVPCQPANEQYYHANAPSTLQPVYDGFTDVVTATALVVPCQPYTITLAISDVADDAFDSGVFLEAKSFGTGSLQVNAATPSADGVVVEGCSEGSVTFSLDNPAQSTFPIDFTIFGTAANGVDFEAIPASISIPAGQSSVTLPIIGREDFLSEGTEFIAFDVRKNPCTRDTVFIYFKDKQIVPPNLPDQVARCVGDPAVPIDGTLPLTLPAPPSFSNDLDYPISQWNALTSPINVFGVQPTILSAGVLQSVCVRAVHPWIDDVDLFLISPGGQFVELSTDNGGSGDNYTNTCFKPTATTKINTPGPFAPASAAPFTGDWLPEGPFSDLWDGDYPTNGTWRLQFRDDAIGFIGVLDQWSITFEPAYKLSYQWSPAAGLSCPSCPQVSAQPAATTRYELQVTDSYGCVVNDSITVVVQSTIPAPEVDCISKTDSLAVFSWSSVPGAAAYEVNLNGSGWIPANGNLNHQLTGFSSASTLALAVRAQTPGSLCPALVDTAVCCLKPTATTVTVPATCFGSSDGSLSVIPQLAVPPFLYALGGQTSTSGVFTNLSAGNYTIVFTDAGGCTAQISATVTAPPALTPGGAFIKPINCSGATDGSITLSPMGGTAPYGFIWSNSQSGNPLSPLAAGTYTATITDALGCTTTATATVPAPPALLANLAATPAACHNQASGSAAAGGNGGTPPYQFIWSTGSSLPTLSGLLAGNYTVTVTDAAGCTTSSTATITQPPPISATVTHQPARCAGTSTGSATAMAVGGTGALTYTWNTLPPQTGTTAVDLPAQSYTVTIVDANGCAQTLTTTVTEPPPLFNTIQATGVDCYGGDTGSAAAQTSGGTPGYTYVWSTPLPQTNPTATSLPAGSYQVTITDANNCLLTQTATIGQPQPLQTSSTTTPATCHDASDGSIAVTSVGGTPAYSYLWSNGVSGSPLSGVGTGTYTATATDANGCTSTTTATLSAPPPLNAAITAMEVDCHGSSTGSLTVVAGGGTPNYSISWITPTGSLLSGSSLTQLPAGSYQMTLTDAHGCTLKQSMFVQQPLQPLMAVLPPVSDTVCRDGNQGKASATASGGTAPYTYLWDPGALSQTTASLTGLAAGFYTVTVTDARFCTATRATEIKEQEPLSVQALATPPTCHNGNNGSARVISAAYGSTNAPLDGFVFLWNTVPPQTTNIATQLSGQQTYQVTLTDAEGCTANTSVSLPNPDTLVAGIVQVENARCGDTATGSATVAATGGQPPYTYFWSNGGTAIAQVSNLPAGTYFVTVTDANACPAVCRVLLTEPPPLRVDLFQSAVKCLGGADGTARAQPQGGTPPYTCLWDSGQTAWQINGLPAGPATVRITDANGCQIIDEVTIKAPETGVSAEIEPTTPDCNGSSNGRITFAGQGGTPPYRYALNSGPYTGSATQIGLKAGDYLPRIIDANGCTATLPVVTLEEPEPIQLDLGPNLTIEIGQDTQLQAVATLGVPPYAYQWNVLDSLLLSCTTCPNPTVRQLTQLRWFTLLVTDAHGCESRGRVQVAVRRPRLVWVPTGFSPNDDAANDYLMVHGQQQVHIREFKVFDRWGTLLYQSGTLLINDESQGWDGTFLGQACDPGVYVWMLEVEYLDGQTELLYGNTTLIR